MGDTKLLGSIAQGPLIAAHALTMGPQQRHEFGAIAVAAVGQLGASLPQELALLMDATATAQTQGNRKQGLCKGPS
jgi:hypothetical protein